MEKIYDLDLILISPRIYQTWLSYCPIALMDVTKNIKGIPFNIRKDIPDEQFRVLPDGTGEIFIKIEKIGKEIKMKVPKNEWSLVQNN